MALLDQKVIDNWAAALTAIAIEQKKERVYIEQANVLVEVLKGQAAFVTLMSARVGAAKGDFDKAQVLDETFQQFGFEPEILNMMKILAEVCAFEYARDVFKKARRMLTATAGVEYGVAWSTEPLDEKTLGQLEGKVSAILGHSAKLVNKIDASLIGGVQVVIENRIFDGSIRGKLNQIRYRIMEDKTTNTEKGVD